MSLGVLIADDESWMRDTIAKYIDWEQYGLRVVGKAIDGLQAYDMILELKPDIVLADIKMPGMDGITLLKRLKENGKEPAFIFFSGYDRFEYAKDAINLGAIGYILKPVDERELLRKLIEAKEHIISEKQRNEEKMQFADLSERVRDNKKTEYISLLLEGTAFDVSNYRNLGTEFVSDYFMVISAEIDRYMEIQKDAAVERDYTLKLALSNVCMDYLEMAGFKVFETNTQKGVVILLNTMNPCEDENRQKVIETCERIIRTFKANMGSSITVGIGTAITGKERIQESRRTSCKALEFKLLAGMGRAIDYGNIYESRVSTVILDNHMEKEVTESFEKSDFTISEKVINRVRKLTETSRLSLDDIRRFNYSFIELVYRLLNKFGVQTGNYCINPHLVYDDMNRCEDLEELFGKYIRFVNESLQLISDRSLNYYKKLADSVKKYIHEHYTENISLESMSQELTFHPNYISRIFKEEFGENFIDYLTNHRIEVAKELLRNDKRLNVFDIADRVGYSNPKYFSKVFKKVVGVTPVEYIKKSK
jgi:two-component system, response regulator YesN